MGKLTREERDRREAASERVLLHQRAVCPCGGRTARPRTGCLCAQADQVHAELCARMAREVADAAP